MRLDIDHAVEMARDRLRLRVEQLAGVREVLSFLHADAAFDDARHAAYALATIHWETARTFRPIDERGSDSYFNTRYGPGTRVGRSLGNTRSGDGARYHGRGYVQLTGRRNYELMSRKLGVDLVATPGLAKDPRIAWQILSLGMRLGLFTGHSLARHISGPRADYVGARRIINGQDRAVEIARLAIEWERILRTSAETARDEPETAAAPLALAAVGHRSPRVVLGAAATGLGSISAGMPAWVAALILAVSVALLAWLAFTAYRTLTRPIVDS